MSRTYKDIMDDGFVVADLINACKPFASMEVIVPDAPDDALCMISMKTYRKAKAAYEAAAKHFNLENKL